LAQKKYKEKQRICRLKKGRWHNRDKYGYNLPKKMGKEKVGLTQQTGKSWDAVSKERKRSAR